MSELLKKKVSMGDLSLILKAGLAAPSGKNLQECNLVVLIEERSISKTIQTIEKAKKHRKIHGFLQSSSFSFGLCAARSSLWYAGFRVHYRKHSYSRHVTEAWWNME